MIEHQQKYRATVSGETLTVAPWHPQLHGPGSTRFAFVRTADEAGCAMIDLTPLRGEEEGSLLAQFLVDGPCRAIAKQVLAEWAEAVGYHRIWFNEEFLDLDPVDAVLGDASITCPTCASEWSEGTPAFWLAVRACRLFPTLCPLCGGLLPQWETTSATVPPFRKGARV